jgi:hypothetical protein
VLPLNADLDSSFGVVAKRTSASNVTVIIDDPLAPIAVTYDLFGGSTGSGAVSLQETITVANLLYGPLNSSLYGYRDWNLSDADQALTVNDRTVSQNGGGYSLTETSDRPARHYEINDAAALLARLSGGGHLTLNDTPAAGAPYPSAPGNAGYAIQWGMEIAPREALVVRSRTTIGKSGDAAVPEPGSLALLLAGGGVGAGLALRGRRRAWSPCAGGAGRK